MKRLALLLSLFSLFWFCEAYAQTNSLLSNTASPAFDITEEFSADGAKLKLRLLEQTKAKTWHLHHPERVVIDLPPSSGLKNKAFKDFSSTLLLAVRLGIHPDKTRLVLDLQGSKTTTIQSKQDERDLIIEVLFPYSIVPIPTATSSAAEQTSAPKEPAVVVTMPQVTPTAMPEVTAAGTDTAAPLLQETPSVSPTATCTETPTAAPPTATATPHPTATRTPRPTATATALPTATGTAQPDSSALPVTTAVQVKKFEYEYEGNDRSPLIRIRLDTKTAFKLSKTADKLYSLSVPTGTFASPGLRLPQFPPRDFAGFTYLQGANQRGGIEVIIGVERGVRITATAQEQDILVRAVKAP